MEQAQQPPEDAAAAAGRFSGREVVLMSAVGGVAALCVSFVLFRGISDATVAEFNRGESLKAEQLSAQDWIAEKEQWTERMAWLDETQPAFSNPSEASAYLLENIQKSVQQHGLTLTQQQLSEVSSDLYNHKVSITVAVTGKMEALVRWLAEMEDPARFLDTHKMLVQEDAKSPGTFTCNASLSLAFRVRSKSEIAAKAAETAAPPDDTAPVPASPEKP